MYTKFWGEFLSLSVLDPLPAPNFMCIPKNTQNMSVNGGAARRDANNQPVPSNFNFQIDCGLVLTTSPQIQLSPGFELSAGTSVQIQVTLNAPFRDPDDWAYENEINIATDVLRVEDKTNNRAVVYIWPDY
jgi:hypothetical protein